MPSQYWWDSCENLENKLRSRAKSEKFIFWLHCCNVWNVVTDLLTLEECVIYIMNNKTTAKIWKDKKTVLLS